VGLPSSLGLLAVAVIAAGLDHRYRIGGTHGDGFNSAGRAVRLFLSAGLDVLSR
jgi:hypothetical protein